MAVWQEIIIKTMTKGNTIFDRSKLKKKVTMLNIATNKVIAEGENTAELIKQAYGKKRNNK